MDVIPGVVFWAQALEASACAHFEAVVKVEANWARELFTEALRMFVVPELSTCAFLRLVNPSAMNLIPLDVTFWDGLCWQANTDVPPVVVVEASRARVRNRSALAPGFIPVEAHLAGFWVALTGTLRSIPVEADRASLSSTVTNTTLLGPEETWLARHMSLHAAA